MEEDQKKMRPDWVVAFSLLECLMFLGLTVLVVGGLGLGAGFYLGTYHKNNQLNAVVKIADDMSTAYQNERVATQVNYDRVVMELEKYETFLIGAGLKPTLPTVTPITTAQVKKTKGSARGGP